MIVSENFKKELEKYGCSVHKTKDYFWVNDDEYNIKYPDKEISVDLKNESYIFNKEVFMKELEEAKEQVKIWSDEIKYKSISNDSYFISYDYKEDKENLEYWERKVRELEEKNNE